MKSFFLLSSMSLVLAGSLLAPSALAAEPSAIPEAIASTSAILPQPPVLPVVPVATASLSEPSVLTLKAATSSVPLAIASAKVEKSNPLPLDFTKVPNIPRVGLKLSAEMGWAQTPGRLYVENNAFKNDPATDLAGKNLRAEWAPLGLGGGVAISGFSPQDKMVWPGQVTDLYALLPGLRFGFRNESFGTSGETVSGKSVGSLFGGLTSDSQLLVDTLHFGYDLNLGVGMWGLPDNNWHINGGGEAFLGYKYDFLGLDLGYRYALSSGTFPNTISPLGLAGNFLGIGDKPQFTMGINQGIFLRTKIYW